MTNDVVQAILAAIPKILAEEARLDKKHGIDPSKNSTLMSAGDGEENVHETALESQLMSFDDESLLKALALVYYGQEHPKRKFEPMLYHFRKREMSKSELVQKLMEKVRSCPRYFAAAETCLERYGLSIRKI